MSEEATAIAATLRACVREGDEYEAISRIGLRAADMLERQAAQLAALRAGADTEDLHAAPASMMALAAEATRLGIDGDDILPATAITKAAIRAVFDRAPAVKQHGHASDRIAALEAEAETLHAIAEGWCKWAGVAEAELSALKSAIADPGMLRQFILRGIIKIPADLVFLYDTSGPVAEKVADARRQALEEAASTLEALPRGLVPIRDAVKPITLAQAIAAIRALADKPAAGGEA